MSFFVKNLSAQRCMLLYWQCQGEPIFVSSDGKAARAAGLFPVVNGSGSMPVMRRQTGASERRQYSDRQEQIRASNTTTTRNRSAAQTAFRPAEQKKSAQPDATNTAAYRHLPIHYSIPQRRTATCLERGSARGKSGLRNSERLSPSQTCPRQSVPPKGKELHCQRVPLERKRPPPRSVRQTPDIVQYLVQLSH